MAAKRGDLDLSFLSKKPQSKPTIPRNHHIKGKRKGGENLLGEGSVKELEQLVEVLFNLVRPSKGNFQQLWEDFRRYGGEEEGESVFLIRKRGYGRL